jgi:hypothetical protein
VLLTGTLHLEVNPAREVANTRVAAGERRFGDSLLRGLSHKFSGDGRVPLLRPVVAIEFYVEHEEATEVAPLGVDCRRRLAGHLGHKVPARDGAEAAFARDE